MNGCPRNVYHEIFNSAGYLKILLRPECLLGVSVVGEEELVTKNIQDT